MSFVLSRLSRFASELQRRRVVRVLVVYAVVGYGAIEVANNVSGPLRLPEWTPTLIAHLVLLGLPVALALAWAFDITPHGIQRTVSRSDEAPVAGPRPPGSGSAPKPEAVARAPRRRSVGYVALGALVAVAGVASYTAFEALKTELPSAAGLHSIGVLPFADLSPGGDQGYFTDGITEEILYALSRVEGLSVPSRSSAFQFRNLGMDIRETGRRLGVQAVVEGSVRKSGDRLRISVQLVDVDTGFRLWSERFDRELKDVFALQEEISAAVLDLLGLHRGREPLVRQWTTSLEAYDQFLRGNYHLARRTPDEVLRAIEAYRRAAELDPGLIAARARQAYALAMFVDWGWSYPGASHAELLREGMALADRVLRDDPASAEAWLTRAYLQVAADPYRMDGALASFEKTIALDPDNAEAFHQYGQTLMVLGRFEDASSAYLRSLALEPERPMTAMALASNTARLADPSANMMWLDSAVALGPWLAYPRAVRAHMLVHYGRAGEALADARLALAVDDRPSTTAATSLAAALAASGERAAASAELERAWATLGDPDRPGPTEAWGLAHALLRLDRADDAARLLERTTPRGAWFWFYTQLPFLEPLQTDPRTRHLIDAADPRPIAERLAPGR